MTVAAVAELLVIVPLWAASTPACVTPVWMPQMALPVELHVRPVLSNAAIAIASVGGVASLPLNVALLAWSGYVPPWRSLIIGSSAALAWTRSSLARPAAI